MHFIFSTVRFAILCACTVSAIGIPRLPGKDAKYGSEQVNCAAEDPQHLLPGVTNPSNFGAEIHVYIHTALLSRWDSILEDFFRRAAKSGLASAAETFTVVAIGNHSELDLVAPQHWEAHVSNWDQCCGAYFQSNHESLRGKINLVRSPHGLGAFEAPTLSLLHAHALAGAAGARFASMGGTDDLRREQLFLYMHTKGVGGLSPSETYEVKHLYINSSIGFRGLNNSPSENYPR